MIGSLRGTLLDRTARGEVLVEVHGVGYRVTVTPSALATIGEIGDACFLYTHHVVREDSQTLYGFATRDERVCFEALLGAHGVGPALALAILSVHDPSTLRRALADDDLAALCLVPGVGRKTAARLLIELKSRLDVPELDGLGAPGAAGSGPQGSPVAVVREALAGLGYGPDEVRDALRDLDGADESSLLRDALRRLGDARRA